MIDTNQLQEQISLVLLDPKVDAEVIAFYAHAVRLKAFAEIRVIATNDDLKPAAEDLSLIATVKKGMEAKRKDYLTPFQNHIKEVNEAYKTLMNPIEQADIITRGKILIFKKEQDLKRQEAEAIEAEKLALARREASLNNGETTVDLTPIAKPEVVPDRIHTDLGSAGMRDHWVFEVVDFALLPDEYKMPDATKIGKVVRAGLHNITGVKIWNEPLVAVNIKKEDLSKYIDEVK